VEPEVDSRHQRLPCRKLRSRHNYWSSRLTWNLVCWCKTDMPVTTAGQNQNRKYNLNIWRPFVFFPNPEVVITEPWTEISLRYLVHSEMLNVWGHWHYQTGNKISAAVLKNKRDDISTVVKYTAGCQIHMKLDTLMQPEIPLTSGRLKLNGEVELFPHGGLLFPTVGTGFVQYYISL